MGEWGGGEGCVRLSINDLYIQMSYQSPKTTIDVLDGTDTTEADTLIEAINDDSFDALPLDKQLEKLMQATQALIDQAKKSGTEL